MTTTAPPESSVSPEPSANRDPSADGAPTLGTVVEFLQARYPLSLAEPWDAVGLVVGDPAAPVRRVLCAVDPVADVVAEAIELKADLLVVHHPQLLRGVTSVAASTPKGAMVHRLISAGCALYSAHTNADSAPGGANDRLAELLVITECVPLVPTAGRPSRAVDGSGEPVATGLGRVGRLERDMTLEEFAQRVAARLPRVAQGVRVAGPLDAVVRTVAVCSGAGDSLFDEVRASGADVYVTSDLRHHPASEAREQARLTGGTPYLVDTSHWASEWPLLLGVQEALQERFALDVVVSTQSSDPWSASFPSTTGESA